jgi:hypothetical protein
MNDKPVIIAGLVVALVAVTFPFWSALYTRATSSEAAPLVAPTFDLPDDQQCVAEDMKARHMQVLNEWRDAVVRDGDTEPAKIKVDGSEVPVMITVDGKERECPKSLTRGCLACHGSHEDFCAKCHEYADVETNCWNCHLDPKQDKPAGEPEAVALESPENDAAPEGDAKES